MVSDVIKTSAITLPANKQSREALLNELNGCRGPQGFVVDFGDSSSSCVSDKSMLFSLPAPQREELIEVDFLGLCLTPPLEDGVHTVENKLEMLALPGNTVDTSRALLNDFEDGVGCLLCCWYVLCHIVVCIRLRRS